MAYRGSRLGDFLLVRRPWAFFVNAAISGVFGLLFLVFALTDDDPRRYPWLLPGLWLVVAVVWVVRGTSALRASRNAANE